MLVRSVIYGWGFDFMRPFQNKEDIRQGVFFVFGMDICQEGFEPERADGVNTIVRRTVV